MAILYSHVLDQKVKQNYQRKSLLTFSLELGVGISDIRKSLVRQGLKKSRPVPINESLFLEPTRENQWFLGFTQADGCVSIVEHKTKRSYHVSFRLSARDALLLNKMVDWLDYNRTVSRTLEKGHRVLKFSISSDILGLWLESYGVGPRKSGQEKLVESPYFFDYLRGVIDGDGSIGKDKLEIYSGLTDGFLEDIKTKLKEDLGVTGHVDYKEGSRTYRLRYRKEASLEILREAYALKPNLFSPRKAEQVVKLNRGRITSNLLKLVLSELEF